MDNQELNDLTLLWEEKLKLFWDWNIDLELGIINESKDNLINIIDLNLKEEITDSWFFLYDWKETIWAIEFSNDNGKIHIDFFATLNWDLSKITSDDEFKQTFEVYFWNKLWYSIEWVGKELFNRFIKKIWSWSEVSLMTLTESKWFYKKILDDFESKWLISYRLLWDEFTLYIN